MPEHSENNKRYKTAKRILKEQQNARIRVKVYKAKRPTFLKQMKVDLSDYDSCGLVNYDKDLELRLKLEDNLFLLQYVEDMENIWIVDYFIKGIKPEKKRQFAEDAFIHGLTDQELTEKYSIAERTIRYRKEQIARSFAQILSWRQN